MKVFVTTGAIAPFYDLIQACLDTKIVAHLVELGYDELRIQYGKGGEFFSAHVPTVSGITITGFDFTPDIQSEVESSDLIISHAGTGSILDAVRSHKPLIVVANTQLMDNHQLEIANQFSQFGYLLVCKPTQDDLLQTLDQSKTFVFKKIPMANSKRVAAIINQEAGIEV